MLLTDKTAGSIKGLPKVVKSHQLAENAALQQTNYQLRTLLHRVASPTKNLLWSSLNFSLGLRLLNLYFAYLYWSQTRGSFLQPARKYPKL